METYQSILPSCRIRPRWLQAVQNGHKADVAGRPGVRVYENSDWRRHSVRTLLISVRCAATPAENTENFSFSAPAAARQANPSYLYEVRGIIRYTRESDKV